MQYTKLGRSNLTVSKLCLGTMHFGETTDQNEAFRIMDKALELGINFFDTANVYGGPKNRGKSEEIIGNWLKQGCRRREQVVIATKMYAPMSDNPNDEPGISAHKANRHLEASLDRLKTDYVDLYQVHHIDRRITPEEYWGTFERFVNNGKVLYTGTSNYPGWGLVKFQMHAERRGFLGIVSEQVQYNLLNRIPELEIIPAAEEMGIGILAYMPLAGGLLAGLKEVPENSRTATSENQYQVKVAESDQLRQFSDLCKQIGQKEYIVATAWTLANPVISSAIVGIRTVEHLEGIVASVALDLDHEILNKLDEIFNVNKGRRLKTAPVPEAFAW